MSNTKPNWTQFGTYAVIKGEATEDKIAEAKEKIVENVCRIIRDVAKKAEDCFIIKSNDDNSEFENSRGITTVAYKFILPIVDDYDLSLEVPLKIFIE